MNDIEYALDEVEQHRANPTYEISFNSLDFIERALRKLQPDTLTITREELEGMMYSGKDMKRVRDCESSFYGMCGHNEAIEELIARIK